MFYLQPLGSGKPRGLRTARKLRTHRREQRWHDKDYKKAHSSTALKANPFGGASHAKGIVLEKVGVEAKQPNSAIRKCVRVQLIKNGKKITAFVPNDGCLNFIEVRTSMMLLQCALFKQNEPQSRQTTFLHSDEMLCSALWKVARDTLNVGTRNITFTCIINNDREFVVWSVFFKMWACF